jgi:hypothetical protein
MTNLLPASCSPQQRLREAGDSSAHCRFRLNNMRMELSWRCPSGLLCRLLVPEPFSSFCPHISQFDKHHARLLGAFTEMLKKVVADDKMASVDAQHADSYPTAREIFFFPCKDTERHACHNKRSDKIIVLQAMTRQT